MGTTEFPVNFGNETYDLKKFLRDHPGGVNTLEKYKGKSVEQAMRLYGHSVSAYHMLKDFKSENNFKEFNLTGDVSANGRIITEEEVLRDAEEIVFLEELESRLDWSKAIVCQLHKIAPHYDKWVNSAVYRDCRLFSNPIVESLTFTPWYVIPIFWIPIILYLGGSQFYTHVQCGDSCKNAITELEFCRQLVTGVVIWSFLEYSLHRWVFHYDPGSSVILIQLHFLIHGIHHKVPFDGLRQVFPPVPAFFIAAALYLPFSILLQYPLIKMTGGLIGYLMYDMIHYYVHHGSPSDGSYLYAMKRYHSNHHFHNHDKAFGISSKFWDYVFRTIVHVRKLGFGIHWNVASK